MPKSNLVEQDLMSYFHERLRYCIIGEIESQVDMTADLRGVVNRYEGLLENAKRLSNEHTGAELLRQAERMEGEMNGAKDQLNHHRNMTVEQHIECFRDIAVDAMFDMFTDDLNIKFDFDRAWWIKQANKVLEDPFMMEGVAQAALFLKGMLQNFDVRDMCKYGLKCHFNLKEID